MSRISIRHWMRALGLKDRKHFREGYRRATVDSGLIEMTLPDKPRSSKQRYRLTETGRHLQTTSVKQKAEADHG
jgi:ATP-dependent DNA helicase RecG